MESGTQQASLPDVRLNESAEPKPIRVVAGAHHEPISDSDLRTAKLVKKELAKKLWEMSPFYGDADLAQDHEALYRLYIDSVAFLDARRAEVFALVDTMKMTSVNFDVPGVMNEKVRKACKRSFDHDFELRIKNTPNISSAILGHLPVDELRERFRASLLKAIDTFVDQMFSSLDNMVDRKTVGLANWPSQNAVKYSFYQRRVHYENHQKETTTSRVERRAADEDPDDPRRWKRITKRLEKLDCVIVTEHHTHEAISAFYTTLENTRVVMPDQVEALVKSIPDWMAPSIRVIDGYLIGERVHASESCREEVVREETIEVPLYGHEPAVLLGPYVFAGWGPREIEETEVKRREEREREFLRKDRGFWFSCAIASQLFTALLLVFASHVFMVLLASFVFLAGIPTITLTLQKHFLFRKDPVPEWQLQAIVAGVSLVCLGIQVFFLPIGLIKVPVGVLLFTVGAVVVNHYARHLFDETWTAKESI